MQAFDSIWQDFSGRILAYIRKRVADPEDALDLRQEVFVQVWQQLPSLRDERLLLPWMYRITRNTIANHFRRSYRDDTARETLLHESDTTEELHVLENELFCCLEPFLAELPDTYREPLHLYMHGVSQQEIADKMGLSLPGAKSRIQRARDLLKERFVACCRYTLGEDGRLHGDPDCPKCGGIHTHEVSLSH